MIHDDDIKKEKVDNPTSLNSLLNDSLFEQAIAASGANKKQKLNNKSTPKQHETTLANGPQLQDVEEEGNDSIDVDALKASLKTAQCENALLTRALKDVSRAGVVGESSLFSVRGNTKDHLFKKVKFLISRKTTDDAMALLGRVMSVKPSEKHDWVNTYLHHVRATMNNK